MNVTEKRHKKRRKILLDAARAVRAYVERAGISADLEGPLFRPLSTGPGISRIISHRFIGAHGAVSLVAVMPLPLPEPHASYRPP